MDTNYFCDMIEVDSEITELREENSHLRNRLEVYKKTVEQLLLEKAILISALENKE